MKTIKLVTSAAMKAVDGQVDTRTPTLRVMRLMRSVTGLDKGTWTSGINMVIADQFWTGIIQMRLPTPASTSDKTFPIRYPDRPQSTLLIYSLDDI